MTRSSWPPSIKTGRKKIVLSGLWTETCVALPTIQAIYDGYEVYVAEDCCGDTSRFGLTTIFVTDGHLPYPYGREMTGYEVANLEETLAKAKSAGVVILTGPYTADHRKAAIVQFPGGHIAEIHSNEAARK